MPNSESDQLIASNMGQCMGTTRVKNGWRHPAVAAILCGALACAGCGGAGQINLDQALEAGKDLKTAFTGVDEKDEIVIGREVAGRTLGAAHLVNDRALQAYVNRVGHWIALQSERPDLPWSFGVIETGSINAFASPGGYVLITRGLYEILDNEAQLAGVLGHEIAHIVRRHHISVMQKSAGLSGVARLAQSEKRSAVLNNIIGSGAEIFARGLDKEAEFEADRRGVVLAARAGYNPYGLIDVLHKLEARGANDASVALLFSTIHLPSERLPGTWENTRLRSARGASRGYEP